MCHLQAAHLNNLRRVSPTQDVAFQDDPLDKYQILQYHVLTHVVPLNWPQDIIRLQTRQNSVL